MPFQSEKQRRYLWANEPEIARDWSDKYGSRVKRANGGVMDIINKYNPFTGVGAGLYGHFQNLGDIKANAPNQRDYNIEATRDLWSNLSKNIQNPVTRGIMDVTSPALSLVTSPIYDAMQAGMRTVYDDKTGKFRGPLDNFDITNTMNPDYKGNPTPGFFTRLDQENPISSAWERYLGASKHLSEKYGYKAANSLAKAWDAIKNEFGGSAEGAIPDDYTSAQGLDVNSIRDLIAKSNMQEMMNASGKALSGKALSGQGIAGIDLEAKNIANEQFAADPTFETSEEEQEYNEYLRSIGQMPKIKDPNMFQRMVTGAKNMLGKPGFSSVQKNYINKYGLDPRTGRIQSGPFQGQNLFGKSMWGSKTEKEQAQRWLDKYKETAPKEKVTQVQNIVGQNLGGNGGVPDVAADLGMVGSYDKGWT